MKLKNMLELYITTSCPCSEFREQKEKCKYYEEGDEKFYVTIGGETKAFMLCKHYFRNGPRRPICKSEDALREALQQKIRL